MCVSILNKKGDGFVVGFGSLSGDTPKFNNDAPTFDPVVVEVCTEDDRVRLIDVSFTVPTMPNNDVDDDPCPAGFIMLDSE